MSKCKSLFVVDDQGDNFIISAGGNSANFRGNGSLSFLPVTDIFIFADGQIKELDLSPKERTDLARDVLDFIHAKVAGRRNRVRILFELPMQTAPISSKKRFLQIRHEMFALISNMTDEYVRKQKAKAAPIRNLAADTMRIRCIEDDALFASDLIRVSGTDIEKRKIIDGLRARTARTVFRDFSGEEYHLFLKIYELWVRNNRPEKIEIEREAFLSELGISSIGGALSNKVEKIKRILDNWSEREAFKIISPPDETANINFIADCYLPRWREYRAEKKKEPGEQIRFVNKYAIGKKIKWIFSDFDILLFGHSDGYRKIVTRPFALLTETLGNTISADRAKHAVGIILTELAYGRKRPFKIKLSTLQLTRDDFAKHNKQRSFVKSEIIKVLASVDADVEFGRSEAIVIPRSSK